ncbi:MAG: hypothetical protein CMH49_09480 [Myxococcales bacterium]|nr:hypothetical protein [Myxococcales bacterium]
MSEPSRRPMDADRFSSDFEIPTSSWIVSYSDIMTIILTFFILLLSISTIAQTKYEMIVQAFTGDKAGNLMEVEQEIKQVIEEQGLSGEVKTKLDMNGLKVSFSNALLFASGDAKLRESAYRALEPISVHLVQKLGVQYGIIIEGYTDDVPIRNGKFASNWELSTSRAITVREVIAKAGLDSRRISVQGFADTRAATEVDLSLLSERNHLGPQELEKARSANRRVVLRIDALPSDLLKRIQAQGGWVENVKADTDKNSPTQSSNLEPALDLELPIEKEAENDQAQ